MAYPNDAPSTAMNNIWTNGNYTPEDIVRFIRDDYTPINKNSMKNSLGEQISLVQNYVNSYYLGRETIPILSGYVSNVISNRLYLPESGSTYVSNTICNNFIRMYDLAQMKTLRLNANEMYIADVNFSYGRVSSTSISLYDGLNGRSGLYISSTGLPRLLLKDGRLGSRSIPFYSGYIRNVYPQNITTLSGTLAISAADAMTLSVGGQYGAITTSASMLTLTSTHAYWTNSSDMSILAQTMLIQTTNTGADSLKIRASGGIDLMSRSQHLDITASGVGAYMTLATHNDGSPINILTRCGGITMWAMGGETDNAPSISIKNKSTAGYIEIYASGNLTLGTTTGYINIASLGNNIIMDHLPTSDPTVAGALWVDGVTLKVSAG